MYDKRKSYYLTIDTETANSLEDPMMYDLGGAIHDRYGNVIETFSFVIYDVFCADRALFDTAYYAEKRPIYEEQIKAGLRKIVSIYTARRHVRDLCEKYGVKAIIAHNARFDYRATNYTLRYVTKSKTRAEILYRYITLNNEFVEDHTGLEDVLIEKEIFAKCMAQHKKMRKSPWE